MHIVVAQTDRDPTTGTSFVESVFYGFRDEASAAEWIDHMHVVWPNVHFLYLEADLYSTIDHTTGAAKQSSPRAGEPDQVKRDELVVRAADVFPKSSFGVDNDGQIVVYTGYYPVPGGSNFEEFGNDLYWDKEDDDAHNPI